MNQTYMKEKKIFPMVMSMAIPMVMSMGLNSVYNIVDSYFVARLSEDAMTALSLVYPAQNLLTAVAVGFGIGINAMIAFYMGENNLKKAEKTVTQGVLGSFLHGLLLMIMFWCGMKAFLQLFTDSPKVIAMGMQYANVVFAFSVMVTVGIAVEKVFQAVGRMRETMISMISGFATNIILDPLLIFGIGPFPRMEIAGAALATGIGQVVTLVVYIVFYYTKPLSVKFRREYVIPEKEICKKIYGIGIPAGISMALPSFLISALNGILAQFSQSYVLVLGIYYKLQTFIYLPTNGIIQGVRPLIGYNYGAGEKKRVGKICQVTLALSAGIMTLGTIVCLSIPGELMKIFSSTESTIAMGATAFRIISFGFILSSVSVTCSGALEALGKGMESLTISLMRYALVIIPAAYGLSRILGANGVWWAFGLMETLTALAAACLFGKVWKQIFPVKQIELILLAAGKGERFGGDKLLTDYHGKPMAAYAIALACEVKEKLRKDAEIAGITVVSGKAMIREMCDRTKQICYVENDNPEKGISYSVYCALERLKGKKVDAVAFMVCDQPELSSETVTKMLESYATQGRKMACMYDKNTQTPGNPCVFDKAYFPELMQLKGDVGGRAILNRYPEQVFRYSVADSRELRDIDTREEMVE